MQVLDHEFEVGGVGLVLDEIFNNFDIRALGVGDLNIRLCYD